MWPRRSFLAWGHVPLAATAARACGMLPQEPAGACRRSVEQTPTIPEFGAPRPEGHKATVNGAIRERAIPYISFLSVAPLVFVLVTVL